ncbi:MAG: DUF6765 family protein [Thermodesulfobacteriota bacterium]
MQIDFHHTATYVIARLAGFPHTKASKIAYAAQYVDDAANEGVIRFDNGAMYSRISSAHHMLDYRNSNALKNRRVWLPFHFLPGNGGLPAGQVPRGRFYKRLVCRSDSFVARDMLKACMADKHKPYGLHRLGIAMHVYADTWAHQGFAGINHKINKAGNIRSQNHKDDARLLGKLANFFLSKAFPLGHGAVLSYPDRPYVDWSYKNGMGQAIARNNPKDFLEAADNMCQAMQRWRNDDPDAPVDGLPLGDKRKIGTLLKGVKNEDGDKRHTVWLKKIAAGYFSFGQAKLSYVPKGRYSWKHKSLGTMEWVDDPQGERFKYKESFLTSDWKMFHDALQAHRFDVIHDILPKFGICAG